MLAKKVRLQDLPDEEQVLTPTYGQRLLRQSLPRYDLPEGEMSPQTAYNVIRDELMLDGNARLNLATFVTTWMEPEARLLMAETFDKNMISFVCQADLCCSTRTLVFPAGIRYA